jgi:insertion element IS1 protein InsB
MCSRKSQRCPYCLGIHLQPKGWSRKKKRRLKCRDCKKHITQDGKNWFVNARQIELIDKLLLERLALRGISRVVSVSLSWILVYIKKLYKNQPDDLNYRLVSKGGSNIQLIKSGLAEMWSFVQKKTNKQWIWIAQCRRTRQVIAFHIGGRGRADAKKLWEKIPIEIKKCGFFYSDDWNAYKGVFPKNRHQSSKQKKDTNHLERLNNTIRLHYRTLLV